MTHLALAVALAFGTGGAAWAQADGAVRQLTEQALYWQKKGRDDRAAEAWEKLLRVDPGHGQALVALGLIAARGGRLADAADYYSRAAALPRPPARLAELRALVRDAPPSDARAEALRPTRPVQAAVRAVETDAAEPRPPRSAAAAESRPPAPGIDGFESMAGTPEGWSAARRGLEDLARANPDDARYRIALARVLTYRENTRREGIRQLAALAGSQPEPPGVRAAWRQALTWLGGRPADRPLYVAYLARHPDDEAVRARLSALERQTVARHRPDPQALARQAGFAALNEGDLARAEQEFEKALARRPQDSDALGGLGTLRLRQQAFDEAVRLLDAAVAADRRGAAKWSKARNAARYWQAMQAAGDARQAGRAEEAERHARAALALDGNEPAAQVLLADLLLERRDLAGAEAAYRRVLRAVPGEPGAFRGLINVLLQSGRQREANALVSALDEESARRIGGLNQVQAALLRQEAEALEAAGDAAGAAGVLEDALLLDPANRWIRLALARQYERLGQAGAAGALLDDTLETETEWPEGWFARAQVLAGQRRWNEALALLERIPPAARSAAMRDEQHRFWVHAQSERAVLFARQGDVARARRLLQAAEGAAAGRAALMETVAGAWSDIGEVPRALVIVRDLIGRTRQAADPGLRIRYAGLLLQARQEAELGPVLRELSGLRLTPAQEEDVNRLILAYTLRLTDALREEGRLPEAWDAVSPALEASDDPRLWMALARIHNTAGDAAEALAIAERVIEREPDDLEHRLFATGAALSARATGKAAGHAAVALELAPDHPRVLAMAGRVEKARGNTSEAIRLFQYALALEREQKAFAGMPGNLSLRLVDANPQWFSGNPASLPLPGARRERGGVLPLPDLRRRADERGALRDPAWAAGRYDDRLPPREEGRRAAEPARRLPLPLADEARPRAPAGLRRPSRFAGEGGWDEADDPYRPARRPAPAWRDDRRPARGPAYRNDPYADGDEGRYREEDYPWAEDEPRAWTPRRESRPPRDPRRMRPLRPARHAEARAALADGDYYDDRIEPAAGARSPVLPARPAREKSLREELDELSLKLSPTLDVGLGARSRSGNPGTSRLRETEVPVEARLPFEGGTLTLRLTSVILDGGRLNAADPRAAAQFGASAFGPFQIAPGAPLPQEDSGTALSVAWRDDNLAADIGTTPLGFARRNLVGGVSISERLDDDLTVRAGILRRAVTDSVLSYAGTQDPLTGRTWGGVVRTGGYLGATLGDAAGGLYGELGHYALTGEHVQDNAMNELSLGGYLRLWARPEQQATVGINLTAQHYRENLSHFTWGHGGYFSPQRFHSLSFPFDLAGRRGRLAYHVGGDVGVRSIRQDAAPYFPGDDAMQAAWAARVAGDPTLAGYSANYAATRVSGAGYGLWGAFEFLLTPDLALGGRFAWDNSRDYTQNAGMVYLRYALDGLPQPVPYPPRPLRALYQGDSR